MSTNKAEELKDGEHHAIPAVDAIRQEIAEIKKRNTPFLPEDHHNPRIKDITRLFEIIEGYRKAGLSLIEQLNIADLAVELVQPAVDVLNKENAALRSQVSYLQTKLDEQCAYTSQVCDKLAKVAEEKAEALGCLDRANKLIGAQADENDKIVKNLEQDVASFQQGWAESEKRNSTLQAQVSSLQSSLNQKIKENEELNSRLQKVVAANMTAEALSDWGSETPSPHKEVAPRTKYDKGPHYFQDKQGKIHGPWSWPEVSDEFKKVIITPADSVAPRSEPSEVERLNEENLRLRGLLSSVMKIIFTEIPQAEGNATPTEKADNSQKHSGVPLEIAEKLAEAVESTVHSTKRSALKVYDQWKEQDK